VLTNLAANARDAMPAGGRFTLRVERAKLSASAVVQDGVVPPGDYVCLVVSDTGTGMDADVRARAFDPFFTTKELGEGTGLGLATVLGIVKQSHGYLRLDSAPGRGATFTVYLTYAPPASVVAEPASAATKRSSS
jgi:two-component system cell cycle sensor histidine kinase/response regulator CckA